MSDYIYGSSLRAAKSKANYLFEGDFRRRPNQNLSGASRSMTGVELLQQAAEQRQNREDTRRKENASLTIQSSWRGHLVRKKAAQVMRQQFDRFITNLDGKRVTRRSTTTGSAFTEEAYERLCRDLLVHYKHKDDEHRLNLLVDLMMQHQDVIMSSKIRDHSVWLHRITKILKIMLRSVDRLSSSKSAQEEAQIGLYLDFISHYTCAGDGSNYILTNSEALSVWRSLIGLNFFTAMRKLADRDLEQTASKNALRKSVIEIIKRSLDVEQVENGDSTSIAVYSLFSQFLRGPVEPRLENCYFLKLLELEPLQLQSKRLLEAFTRSNKLVAGSWTNDFILSNCSTLINSDNQDQSIEQCKDITWLCYMFLRALYTRIDHFSESEKVQYVNVVARLIAPAQYITNISILQATNSDTDEQNDEDLPDIDLSSNNSSRLHQQSMQYHPELHSIITKIIELINTLPHINSLKSIIFNGSDQVQSQVQSAILKICNLMLAHEYLAIFNCRLLYTIAFSKEFSRSLWRSVITTTDASLYSPNIPIHHLIIKSSDIRPNSWAMILPRLKLFCCLCSYLLPTLGDEEFYTSDQNHSMLTDEGSNDDIQMYRKTTTSRATTISSNLNNLNNTNTASSSTGTGIGGFYVDRELVGISAILRDICVGLIEIIYQGNKHHDDALWQFFSRRSTADNSYPGEKSRLLTFEIKSCFQALVRLVCQLHARDSRKQFCPDGHWICPSVVIPANKAIDFQLVTSQQGRLLNQITKDDQTQDKLASISSEIKTVLILQEIPFVISFHDRVQIFHQLLKKERQIYQTDGYHFGLPGSAISVQIRRNYIYEDAFEELSLDNVLNMKLPLKVSLINAVGAEEAGIDGGGLTKEFLSELLKTGFDPMRGFFKYTKDHFLYPNPSANVLFDNSAEGYEVHYEFLGRMLGKAIFEKIMVELPLAGFFLAKLLAAKNSSDVDLHNLESLDPVLYKNLVYLKNYKGDVADLNLDFTISNNELDEHEIIELRPGGSKIPVTRENKIEYVHLVADYRLNKQIRVQCAAFKRGLAQLIDLDWLRMFDPRELQILISGTPTVIDVDDWQRHTLYGNGYTNTSEAISTFWSVVRQLDESQKRKLLKFATSCSLPPLLGFKDLVPQFAIAPAEEARLPTASTCMNLLKLPACEDEDQMRSKLLYAIESGSGFELS